MNQINDENAYPLLQQTGFTVAEIDRLLQLRRHYRANTPLDYAHLQFARWLVTTGRLTDQIAQEDNAPAISPLEKKPILQMIIARLKGARFP